MPCLCVFVFVCVCVSLFCPCLCFYVCLCPSLFVLYRYGTGPPFLDSYEIYRVFQKCWVKRIPCVQRVETIEEVHLNVVPQVTSE
jgi:hypothetical protein